MASSSRRLRQLSVSGASSSLARLAERVHLTLTGLAVLGLVVLGWFSARALGAKTMYLMVYGSALAVFLAWFVSRRRLALEVDRSELPLRMRAGQVTSVELRVTARRRVSTIMLEETLPDRFGTSVHVPVASLRSGEELVHRYTFSPTLRGVYEVGPTAATWSDPFGFTTHVQALAEPTEVIVHPRTELVHDRVLTRMWEDPPIRPPVSKPWPVGFEFYGMRDYVPGDDLRRVVWPVVAKTGRMMVRESEQGITDRVVLFVDTDREWHSPGEVSDTFETAIGVAASVGVKHLEDGFSLTLMTNEGTRVAGMRGSRAHLPYLDELARLQYNGTPMTDAGFALLEEARSRPHFVVITPHLDAKAAQQIKLVVDRGVSVVVALVLWDETDPSALARAASIGCQIVQIPHGASIEAVFASEVSAGVPR